VLARALAHSVRVVSFVLQHPRRHILGVRLCSLRALRSRNPNVPSRDLARGQWTIDTLIELTKLMGSIQSSVLCPTDVKNVLIRTRLISASWWLIIFCMACVHAHNFSHGALGALALLVDFWIDVERERVVTRGIIAVLSWQCTTRTITFLTCHSNKLSMSQETNGGVCLTLN
jgi:hypothetical protein